MPRRSRAYGLPLTRRVSGGSTRRVRKKGKNLYAAKQPASVRKAAGGGR